MRFKNKTKRLELKISYGYQEWFRNGNAHRLDGPAFIHPNGYQAWWNEGRHVKLLGPWKGYN